MEALNYAKREDGVHIHTLLQYYHHRLSSWEMDFLGTCRGQVQRVPPYISEKQRPVLDELIDKYLGDQGVTVSEEALWR